MDRPSYLPEELDNKSLKWLRSFGYCLNSKDERYKRIKDNLKKWYTYEYYFYVDLEIKEMAEANIINKEEGNEWKNKFSFKFKTEKRRLIKAIYGLDKKGIR